MTAFTTLRTRLADGERFTLGTAADVAAIRTPAVDAIEDAMAEVDRPALARELARTLSRTIRSADGELGRVDEEVQAEWLTRDVGWYVYVEAMATALPAANARVVGAITAD